MSINPLDVPPGSLSLDAVTVLTDAINEASTDGQIIADNVLIASVVGDIDLNSAGDVSVQAPVGAMAFESFGDIRFQSNNGGQLNFTTLNGPVNVTSASMQFQTETGDIAFDSTANPSNITFTAGTARIQLNAIHLNAPSLQIFANNAAAIAGGLVAGDLYRTGANPDPVFVVH